MNYIVIAHRVRFEPPPDWASFVMYVALGLVVAVLTILWHHRSPHSKKRSAKFYVLLSVFSTILTVLLLSVTFRYLYGESIEERIKEISNKDPAYYEELLGAMERLSIESQASLKQKIIMGTESKQIPPPINKLSPHSIHLKGGEIKILLSKKADENLFLSLGTRHEEHYLLLNYTDDAYYGYRSRELYPHSRIQELLE